MEIKSDTPAAEEPDTPIAGRDGIPTEEETIVVEEIASPVEAVVEPKPKKATPKKKATVKRKKPTPRKQRPKQPAKSVKPTPVPLTVDEVRKVATEAKDQLVVVAVEPAVAAMSAWSETLRGAVGGFMDGLLGKKKDN